MTDRAQSTTVGFVVIFGTVLVMVGLVSVSGFAALEDVRDEERVTNGVRSFEVLATNVDDVAIEGVPSRTTTVKLDGVSLSVGPSVTFEVRVPADGFRKTVETRPLVLDAKSGTRVVYANGAVLREDRAGQVMARPPRPLVTADYARLHLVRTRPVAATSVGGQTTASVRTTANGTTVASTGTAGETVYLNVTSPRHEAWGRSLDSHPQVSCAPVGGETVSCVLTTDETTVSVTDVDVRLGD
ncbi:hypothetical protein NDI85_11450 [Halomicroarcula sp. S1AR25-4]|uniref:DUF7289 family protein n=1 Tax=Haloarcula sp. S1AR25-4 TaxID=2950538 RepID=UPI0028747AC5|nr:hypothetical protein [Halomicroarcula sp. S1AR25-4]MDS0278412.1 hypothetical protein [Halomicroarcula sp. S1AR25-4]